MANNWKGIIFDKLKGKEKTIDKNIAAQSRNLIFLDILNR